MTDTALAPDRYLHLIDVDTQRLLDMADLGLDVPVPSCPGWSVADLVEHVAMVYSHKVRVMGDGAFPQDWPPAELEGREPRGFLREAKEQLFDEFARHEPSDQTATFGADKTVGFWLRRMALEIAVHRYDGELAHAHPSPIGDDIALDGIDEILRVMLAGPWWDSDEWQTEHPIDAVVAVESGGLRWLCDLRQSSVTIRSGGGAAKATVAGAPHDVFLWLWGRVGDDAVRFGGDAPTAVEFRLRIADVSD
jgi:uncharacterized protein (TIGR03083 family)